MSKKLKEYFGIGMPENGLVVCDEGVLDTNIPVFFNEIRELPINAEFIKVECDNLDISKKVFKKPLVILCESRAEINAKEATFHEGFIAIGYTGYQCAPSVAGVTGKELQPVIDFIDNLKYTNIYDREGVSLSAQGAKFLFSDPKDVALVESSIKQYMKNEE